MCGIAGSLTGSNGQGSLADIAGAMSGSLKIIAGRTTRAWVGRGSRHRARASPPVDRRICRRPATSRWCRPMAASSWATTAKSTAHEDMRPSSRRVGVDLPRPLRHRGDAGVDRRFGIAATVPRLIGMFAIALWDRQDRTLTLVRDRLGIKPLYWAKFGGSSLFGSELRRCARIRGWTPASIAPRSPASCATTTSPPPARSIEGVRKLRAGHDPHASLGRRAEHRALLGRARGRAQRASDPLERRRRRTHRPSWRLLKDAVRRRMIADVPLGAFCRAASIRRPSSRSCRRADAGRCRPSRSASMCRATTRRPTPRRSPATSAPSTPS